MEKLRRILKWLVAGVGALLFLAVVIVAIYTRTENFTHWLREEAITVVNQTIRGTISVDRLEGSVWSRLTLYNVKLRHEQEVALEYQVAPNWKIGTRTSSKGSSGIDIIWNKRY